MSPEEDDDVVLLEVDVDSFLSLDFFPLSHSGKKSKEALKCQPCTFWIKLESSQGTE
jgi:hypothetical protein